MPAAPKLALRRTQVGTFAADQSQRLAQQVAQKANQHTDALAALVNRAYAALAVDATLATAASYATLLQVPITTVLANGYLLVTFTASLVKITTIGNANFRIVVDGVAVKGAYATAQVVNTAMCVSMVVRVPVSRGPHLVQLQWLTNSNSVRINAASIAEEHAHLLVQEAA